MGMEGTVWLFRMCEPDVDPDSARRPAVVGEVALRPEGVTGVWTALCSGMAGGWRPKEAEWGVKDPRGGGEERGDVSCWLACEESKDS